MTNMQFHANHTHHLAAHAATLHQAQVHPQQQQHNHHHLQQQQQTTGNQQQQQQQQLQHLSHNQLAHAAGPTFVLQHQRGALPGAPPSTSGAPLTSSHQFERQQNILGLNLAGSQVVGGEQQQQQQRVSAGLGSSALLGTKSNSNQEQQNLHRNNDNANQLLHRKEGKSSNLAPTTTTIVCDDSAASADSFSQQQQQQHLYSVLVNNALIKGKPAKSLPSCFRFQGREANSSADESVA